MNLRLFALFALLPIAAGCGHTEIEWQQKVREVDALNGKLSRMTGDQRKHDEDAQKAQEEIAQLKTIVAAQSRGSAAGGAEQRAASERMALEQQLVEQMAARTGSLRKKLEPLGKSGVSVGVRRGRLSVLILAEGLFEGGATELAPRGRETLKAVAEALSSETALLGRNFVVVGHSDKASEREEQNQARSAQRAQAVRDFLVGKRGGLPAGRWASVGRGSLEPFSPDDSPEAKARNRRVELLLEPDAIELPDYAKMVP